MRSWECYSNLSRTAERNGRLETTSDGVTVPYFWRRGRERRYTDPGREAGPRPGPRGAGRSCVRSAGGCALDGVGAREPCSVLRTGVLFPTVCLIFSDIYFKKALTCNKVINLLFIKHMCVRLSWLISLLCPRRC